MLSHTFARFRRSPMAALGVLLFAAVLAAVLCGLQAANEAEIAHYEEVRHTIPVTVTVTNLTGTFSDKLDLPDWVISVFDGSHKVSNDFTEYVKDVKIRGCYPFQMTVEAEGFPIIQSGDLFAVTSFSAAEELESAVITWKPGYDESIFAGTEAVCLVPEGFTEAEAADLTFIYIPKNFSAGEGPPPRYAYATLTVAGTYSLPDADASPKLYAPWAVLPPVYKQLELLPKADCISATLIDNDTIAEFREYSKNWFAEPNISGEHTDWHYFTYVYYDHYPFALDINETLLKRAADTLETSIAINRASALLVFALSAGAGFFVGFLMVRSRKREITIMRTMGTPGFSIYLGFVLEQMLAVVLGTALGGACFRWQPITQLGLFVGIYFVGLTAALIIFLRKNLMSTMKEDE